MDEPEGNSVNTLDFNSSNLGITLYDESVGIGRLMQGSTFRNSEWNKVQYIHIKIIKKNSAP